MAKKSEKKKTCISISRKSHPLYPKLVKGRSSSIATFLCKAAPAPGTSKQQAGLGRKAQPFNFQATSGFKNSNSHHSACIETGKSCTVGLGFKTDEPSKKLDPFCNISFQDVLGDVGEDWENTGNGYMEVVREGANSSAPFTGLHHVPASSTWLNIENRRYQHHFEVIGSANDSSALWIGDQKFSAFGDIDLFTSRFKVNEDDISEIIHFRRPTALSRWYGMPRWIAAVAAIELKQCLYQYNYDFFLNRGVPEFLLFLLGAEVDKENMDLLEETLQSHIGGGNTHKSGIFNLPISDLLVQLERLGMDSTTGDDGFQSKSETLALDIVTAHQVPSLLAGIQIPGKLGATNEMVNAMTAYQTLVIGPDQTIIEAILKNTLGNELYNGGLGLNPESLKFETILDKIDIQKAETIGGMREEATNTNRDLKEGLKD